MTIDQEIEQISTEINKISSLRGTPRYETVLSYLAEIIDKIETFGADKEDTTRMRILHSFLRDYLSESYVHFERFLDT